jgi:ABC-2 type transport system ATP-binding protein
MAGRDRRAANVERVSNPVVVADRVAKHWGATPVLREVTFTIGPGVTGLLGANGAGKTTLLGMLLGLHRPDGGSLTVLGGDPWAAGPDVRARLGYAPEYDALPPDVAAADAVRLIAELHGLPHREATGRASDALWEVGLGEERFRPVGTMSTGQRQRVKLAQAIVHDPELVLLDEPTNGLDPAQREDMLELIHHVGQDLGMDVILSSHLLEEVEQVSDAVVIIEAGIVVARGTLADLQHVGEELVVDVDGGADAAGVVIEQLGHAGVAATSLTGGRIVVALERPVVYDIVRDVLADSGIGLRRLQKRRASLEEVYLDASNAARLGAGSNGTAAG